jgi:hypothetical protein
MQTKINKVASPHAGRSPNAYGIFVESGQTGLPANRCAGQRRLKFSCAPRSCETVLRTSTKFHHDQCRAPLARLCQPGATGRDDCAHMLSRQFAARWRGAGAGRHADLQMPYSMPLSHGVVAQSKHCISGAHATLHSLGWVRWWVVVVVSCGHARPVRKV